MSIKDTSFSDMPRPSHEGSKGFNLRNWYMNSVTNRLSSILSKRQDKFNKFADRVRTLQEKIPATYVPADQINKMSSKCHWMSLSEEDYEDLNHWVNKYAKDMAESKALLDKELYFKYTRLFYYSYLIRVKEFFERISSIF